MSDDAISLAEVRAAPLVDELRVLLADAARALGAAESTLWLFVDDGDTMAAALNHGPTASIVEAQTVPAGESVVGFVATQATPFVIGPGEWQNPTVMRATGTAVTAMVAVPVRVGEEVIGALSVINPSGRSRFGALDLEEAARWAGRMAWFLEQRFR